MIVAALTDIAGSSAVVDRGFITYSNDAKMEMIGVSAAILDAHGAVSLQTAEQMAAGALARSHAGIALSVTGIAGPDGGSAEKPVGLVHFAVASRNGKLAHAEKRFGPVSRAEVRKRSVLQAFAMLHDMADGEAPNPPRQSIY
jgi:nicotinamide-nucleotide amidase